MEVLDATNAALKTRGVKGRIVVAKDRFFLRGTFTAADGTRKDRRIALGLNAHQGQLLEAEARVLQLASIINSTGMVPALLPWDAPVPIRLYQSDDDAIRAMGNAGGPFVRAAVRKARQGQAQQHQ